MAHSQGNGIERATQVIVDRTVVAVFLCFLAFYPVSFVIGYAFESVWEVPVLATAYGIYFTVAYTIPAALTIPGTELVVGSNVYHADSAATIAASFGALGSCYVVLSVAIARTFQSLRAIVVR